MQADALNNTNIFLDRRKNMPWLVAGVGTNQPEQSRMFEPPVAPFTELVFYADGMQVAIETPSNKLKDGRCNEIPAKGVRVRFSDMPPERCVEAFRRMANHLEGQMRMHAEHQIAEPSDSWSAPW